MHITKEHEMVLQTVETKAQNWNKNDGPSYIDLAVFAITPKKKIHFWERIQENLCNV